MNMDAKEFYPSNKPGKRSPTIDGEYLLSTVLKTDFQQETAQSILHEFNTATTLLTLTRASQASLCRWFWGIDYPITTLVLKNPYFDPHWKNQRSHESRDGLRGNLETADQLSENSLDLVQSPSSTEIRSWYRLRRARHHTLQWNQISRNLARQQTLFLVTFKVHWIKNKKKHQHLQASKLYPDVKWGGGIPTVQRLCQTTLPVAAEHIPNLAENKTGPPWSSQQANFPYDPPLVRCQHGWNHSSTQVQINRRAHSTTLVKNHSDHHQNQPDSVRRLFPTQNVSAFRKRVLPQPSPDKGEKSDSDKRKNQQENHQSFQQTATNPPGSSPRVLRVYIYVQNVFQSYRCVLQCTLLMNLPHPAVQPNSYVANELSHFISFGLCSWCPVPLIHLRLSASKHSCYLASLLYSYVYFCILLSSNRNLRVLSEFPLMSIICMVFLPPSFSSISFFSSPTWSQGRSSSMTHESEDQNTRPPST